MDKKQLTPGANRLTSLDALRGFIMFWLIGAERIADALSDLNFPGVHLLAAQLNHASWNGFTFYDLIYPMFIFIVGVSTAFSISRRQERGDSPFAILKHIGVRGILLFLLGIYLSNSGLNLHGWLTNIRLMGVLQRIAVCYVLTAILVVFTRPRFLALTAGVFLVGYWLLLRFTPVPGYGAGVWYPPEANFANYFDKLFLPGRLYYHTWDVEGLLSTFPAIASCIFGVLTGFWLKNSDKIKGKLVAKEKKALILAIAGVIAAGLGLLWGIDFPINKKIWTSSYALLTGGLSAVGLALFYWIIDIKGFKKWAFPFLVIGLNSIFIYLAINLIPFNTISSWLIGEKLLAWVGPAQTLCVEIVTFLIGWLILYVMYKRKIFLRL